MELVPALLVQLRPLVINSAKPRKNKINPYVSYLKISNVPAFFIFSFHLVSLPLSLTLVTRFSPRTCVSLLFSPWASAPMSPLQVFASHEVVTPVSEVY
jgi:hypothetical protein